MDKGKILSNKKSNYSFQNFDTLDRFPTVTKMEFDSMDNLPNDNKRRNSLLYEETKKFMSIQELIGNINASFSLTLITIPTALFIITKINNHLVKEDQLPISIAMLSLVFGFVMSFLINGGTPHYKSFTITQIMIILQMIKNFGIGSLFVAVSINGI